MDGREIGVKFSDVDPLPRCPDATHSSSHDSERPTGRGIKNNRKRPHGRRGVKLAVFSDFLRKAFGRHCVFMLGGRPCLIVYASGSSVYCARFFMVCAVAFCLFARWAGLFFTWAFPPACLLEALTDLPSSASSAAPDVKVALLRSDLHHAENLESGLGAKPGT